MPLSLSTAPFLAHILIETPAALTFILRPSAHVSPLPPSASLLLQSLGGLLLATNLIALVFVRRPFDEVSRHVALALAFWHLWPCYRAFVRLRHRGSVGNGGGKKDAATEKTLGGPVVHLVVHLVLLIMFLGTSVFGSVQELAIKSIS